MRKVFATCPASAASASLQGIHHTSPCPRSRVRPPASLPIMDSDLELSISFLSEGFAALCEEYKALAAQHSSLERRLAQSNQECDRLRELCPGEEARRSPDPVSVTEVKTSLPLSEWLDNIRGSSRTDASDSVARIKQAEIACLRLSSRLHGTQGACPFNTPTKRQLSRSSKSYCPAPLDTIPDMEEDFTTPGNQSGKLGCPFAAGSTQNDGKHRMPPTPRSSRSYISSLKPRSRRQSFHDPLNPSVIISAEGSGADVSRSASIAGSGPACPIRFLGQHSPEDIAKYFQEHKHELPRSHEICVKRFQDNSEDIRKLDAKYGNLVNMIQGLGQKHRPMLPTNPVVFDDDVDFDESRDKEKIASWANAVSDEAVADEPDEVNDLEQRNPSNPGVGPERVSHFDRPLREVRVGESPSRPWGVSIPLKYLEREPETGSTHAEAEAEAAVKTEKSIRADPGDKATNVGPKGKCPFDHKAMAAMGGMAAMKHADPHSAPAPVIDHTSSVDARPRTYAQAIKPLQTAVDVEHQDTDHEQEITNNGIMVVGDEARLKGLHVVNNGTLLLGLDLEAVKRLMQIK
ncbi:hypothetical protein FH972_021487 [Carpinus fangiana]|uniref:Uncharacterized protein n=1 Tax=Carpinus fangiana TaxID=176857 RepID=A0A5N6KPU2_9ROSI|nr:hypothetical protein FH972_021487 [Carpinus fangiana]